MEKLIMPKAILFDWDNTLVNTWPIIYQALKDTFDEYGMKPWTLEEVKAKVARSMRDAFPELFGENWEEAGKRYQFNYRKYHIEQLQALKGATELLEMLSKTGIPLAIVSNKKNVNLREEITHLGWDRYFSAIVGSGDSEHDKPHPGPILFALEKLGLPHGPEVWFIGDSHVDLEAAGAAGLTAIFYGDEVVLEDAAGGKTHKGFAMHHHALDHDALIKFVKIHL